MSERIPVFQLERFTIAHPAGRPAAGQVVARSAGIRPDHVVECRRIANLSLGAQPPTFGIFRGETIDYVLAKAVPAPNGSALIQFALAPAAAMRALGGNIRLLLPFVAEPIGGPGVPLAPFDLAHPTPPNAKEQDTAISALMNICKGNLKVLSGLLAGLVQGLGINIVNAPPGLRERLAFIQGLVCMLPAPVRMAVTFVSHVEEPAASSAQIKYVPNAEPTNGHVIFDWRAGLVNGAPPDDPYTKFIMQQMRLDIANVIDQTTKLGRTAVWRAMRRENMASALAWASKRASLDELVLQGLPADRNMVAAVLREDPTLSDDLRTAYSRHLLSLSLALGDYSGTDIIPALAAQSKEIADTVYELLWGAAGGERAMDVYSLVERWTRNAPPGADFSRWRSLMGMAITARLNTLLAGDPSALAAFMATFLSMPAIPANEPVIGQVITLARRRADSPEVANMIMLLGFYFLSTGNLQRLQADAALVAQIGQPLRSALGYLQADGPKPAPASLLAKSAETYGPEHAPILLGRLAEWALAVQREDLIDVDALRGLLRVMLSPHGERFRAVLGNILEDLSDLNTLRALGPAAQSTLIALYAASGDHDSMVQQVSRMQDVLYQGVKADMMAEVVRATFREMPLPLPDLFRALDALHRAPLRPALHAKADLGTLEGRNWDATLAPLQARLSAALFADPRLITAIGVEPALRLLRANVDQQNAADSLRVMGAITAHTLTFSEQGERTAELMSTMYGLVSWEPEVSNAAMDIVRDYIRRAPVDQAERLPALIGAKHGEPIRRILEATHYVRMMTNGADFAAFAEQVRTAAALLTDMAAFYQDGREVPPVVKLRRNIESMSGGLSDAETRRLSSNLSEMSEQILTLYQRHVARTNRRSRPDGRSSTAMLAAVPTTAIELLRWVGMFLGQGRTYRLQLAREAPNYLFGTRSLNMLLRETDLIVALLAGLIRAIPESGGMDIDIGALQTEITTLWEALAPHQQREIGPDLTEGLQNLANVLLVIGEKANERQLQNRQLFTGRAQPRAVLEMLKWMSGYFAAAHP